MADEAGGAGDFVERRVSGLRIRIDRSLCIASSNCMKLAPEVFEFDEENICSFKGDPPDIERERMIEACDVCPVDALAVFDAEGRQLVP